MAENPARCPWCLKYPAYIDYHDKEWGVPVKDDKTQFEFLLLESFQAGVSWWVVLKKRDNFRRAFDNFDYQKIAQYDQAKIESLLQDEGIIRNRLKVKAQITNAQAFMNIQKEFGSFNEYIWAFVNQKPIVNKYVRMEDVPVKTELSDQISKDLKKRGFKFLGSTVVYAHMQATGLVNDHLVDCFRYNDLA